MLTTADVDHLMDLAEQADDEGTVDLCRAALDGDRSAWRECERIVELMSEERAWRGGYDD